MPHPDCCSLGGGGHRINKWFGVFVLPFINKWFGVFVLPFINKWFGVFVLPCPLQLCRYSSETATVAATTDPTTATTAGATTGTVSQSAASTLITQSGKPWNQSALL